MLTLASKKIYELSLVRDYVRHWGMVEAVRELIQNSLDSDSPFVYEIEDQDDGRFTLALRSEFAQLPVRSLLLGSTSKAESPDSIGSFGEGYKIALLVLAREGFEVLIFNGDKQWRPLFQMSSKFNEEILCVEEKPMPFRHTGLTWRVCGLDQSQVDEVRASCLQMQSHIGSIHSTPKGDILLERPGKLYVGGLFICDTELKYGYNVKPEFVKLERDRKTVDGWDLKTITYGMWVAQGNMETLAELIEAEAPDVEWARWGASEMVKDACYRLFRSKHPGKIVAKDKAELEAMIKKGMTNTVYVGASYGACITGSSSYRSETFHAPPPSPKAQMEAWFKKAKYHMHVDAQKSFDDLLSKSANWIHK